MDVETTTGAAAVEPQVVYGYIRMEEPEETEIARLRDELARYCLGHGFHFGGVFCDRGVGGEVVARAGFTAALDALGLPDSFALLVPTREHLSPLAPVELCLQRLVARTGSRIILVHGGRGQTAAVA